MTLVRKIVTGAEDPRLLYHQGRLVLSINSLPPVKGGAGFWDSYAASCPVTVSQMYTTYLNPSPAAPPGTTTAVSEDSGTAPLQLHYLDYGRKKTAEKNWISFGHQDQMYLVYSLFPHIVLVADPGDGRVAGAHETSFNPLRSLSRQLGGAELRGSAQAVMVHGSAVLTPHYPSPHYLAMFHAHDPSTHRYVHFAYRFLSEPPFAVVQVSRQLPILERPGPSTKASFGFVTGLTFTPDDDLSGTGNETKSGTVVITYGAGDDESRALVMSMSRLDSYFCE
jgi:hypothetical protein